MTATPGATSQRVPLYVRDSANGEWYKAGEPFAHSHSQYISNTVTPSYRNVIRNGDMSISQRGNGPFTGNAIYTIDGFVVAYSGGTTSVSRVIQAPGLGSPLCSVVVSGQSVAANYHQIFAVIEDVNTLNGQVVTLSFSAKAASGTPKIAVEIQQAFGGAGGSAQTSVSVSSVTLSTTLQRYTMTFTIPTTVGKTLGSLPANAAVYVVFWLSGGSNWIVQSSNIGIQNNTFYITDVQLEAGSVATPFERLPQQMQLAWCQRYFQRFVNPPLRGGVGATAMGITCSGATLPVSMRAPPSLVTPVGNFWVSDGVVQAQVVSMTTIRSTVSSIEVAAATLGGSGLTIGRAASWYVEAGFGYFDISAEL